MAEGWPLFAASLANMEQVIAKSDMGIAGHYAGLVEDDDLREHVFSRIRDGWRATHDGLLWITGQRGSPEKRSDERRVGQGGVSQSSSRWGPGHVKTKRT